MNNDTLLFEIAAQRDEQGHFEEFSWDLIPVVPPNETLHLDENGLPRIGSHLHPGMILVGKIGKSALFEDSFKPTSLELNTMDFDDLKSKYQKNWIDGSVRVPKGCFGEVIESRIESGTDGNRVAFVRLKLLL